MNRREERSRQQEGRLFSTKSAIHTLIMPLEQVLMQIKDNHSLKWPKKIKGDPNKRNRNKYFRFHRDHRHDTNECFDLKQ